MSRFPVDLVLSPNDFLTSGWERVLAERREGYFGMWRALSSAAQEASESESQATAKALWLTADACSMMLVKSSTNDPFRASFRSEDGRSAVPDDFSPADLAFFGSIVDSVDDPWLKARLADLIWVAGRPRQVDFALKAIDAYRSIPVDAEPWARGGKECLERAIALTRMLGRGAGPRLGEIEDHLLTVLDATSAADAMWALSVEEVLRNSRLGRARARDLADKFRHLGVACQANGDLHAARASFESATEWYRLCDDDSAAAEMLAAKADAWTREGLGRRGSRNPSFMAAASFFEHALQTYRLIPGTHRARLDVDRRVAQLLVDLQHANERSLDEMGRLESPPIDITEIVEQSRRAVAGKDGVEALRALATMCGRPNKRQLRENALEMMRRHPLQALFGRTTLSRDGRVIAKRPGISMHGTPTPEDEIAIQAQMIGDFGMTVGLKVQGQMAHALSVLVSEHRFTLTDFVVLAADSPIIPPGREKLVGKALYAGLEGDFSTALHLLAPQVENMVRYHLKQVGVRTTTVDLNGIENELGLSSLMELEQVEAIFGPDLCFEIRAVYCEATGPNLRNEVAHGLLDDEAAESVNAAYAWWMMLRLVFVTWWNTARRGSVATSTSSESSGGAKPADHREAVADPNEAIHDNQATTALIESAREQSPNQ